MEELISNNSTVLLFVVFVAMLIVFLSSKIDKFFISIVHMRRSPHRRDPQRVFTQRQKRKASILCGWRCEGTGILGRCDYYGKDLHGDHWYPHSRGGATTEKNLVMLCSRCNRRKSDRIPSRLQTWALRCRRRFGEYRPGVNSNVGEWLPLMYNSKRK